MKAFVAGVVVALLLAVAGAFVLQGYFSRSSDLAFAAASARPTASNSIEHRGWNLGTGSARLE